MKIKVGDFEKIGWKDVSEGKIFTFSLETPDAASICIYKRKDKTLLEEIFLDDSFRIGDVYSVLFVATDFSGICYRIHQKDKYFVDAYATSIAGRQNWGDEDRIGDTNGCYGLFLDLPKRDLAYKNSILASDMILYKLHMRGFTMQHGLKASQKGRDLGLIERLPYLRDLGITSIELMPIYEFEEVSYEKKTVMDESGNANLTLEPLGKINYWGYGDAYYFAPKAAYFGEKDSPNRCKDMIDAIHSNGMEVIMEMCFLEDKSADYILQCLIHWVCHYGVDGFHLLGNNIPIETIAKSPYLSKTKIFCDRLPDFLEEKDSKINKHIFLYKDDFMYVTRSLQNHMDGSMVQFTNFFRRQNKNYGFVNYMANTSGFTLYDSFSYGEKHNLDNGEDNRDGSNFNCSFNYGVEGPTKNKQVLKTRYNQVKNALTITLLSQATPLLLAGDECLNSASGNNNPYCQDNPVGWANFSSRSKEAKNLQKFVKNLIAFRKENTVIRQENAMKFNDYLHVGMPDLSYHGAEPWLMQVGDEQKAIGIMYSGQYAKEENHVYIALNFHYEKARIALPKLPDNKKWVQIMNTTLDTDEFLPMELDEQRCVDVFPQSISLLVTSDVEEVH